MSYQDDVAFLKRLGLMRDTSVPALFMQDGDFDVQVRVSSSAHARLISQFTPFTPVRDWVFDYDIQTRHDADDIVLPGYIQEIQSYYDGTPRIVTFQIKKYDWHNAKTHEALQYGEDRCSMFSSYLSPRENTNIFSEKHGDLGRLAPVSISDKDLCRLVIHEDNKLSKINRNDKEI